MARVSRLPTSNLADLVALSGSVGRAIKVPMQPAIFAVKKPEQRRSRIQNKSGDASSKELGGPGNQAELTG